MTAQALLCVLASVLAVSAHAGQPRSAAEKHAFQREHACPSTGQHRGKCPGYVIDHIDPLCHGGPDKAENMQWQTVPEAKVKDRWERRLCRKARS